MTRCALLMDGAILRDAGCVGVALKLAMGLSSCGNVPGRARM